MVRRRDDDNVARQVVDLQQERADYPLDLPCFVNVAAFLSNYVELVEEEHASAGAHLVEEPGKAHRRLAEVAAMTDS